MNTIIADMSSHKLNLLQQSLAQAQYDDMVCCSFPSVVMTLSLTTTKSLRNRAFEDDAVRPQWQANYPPGIGKEQ